MVGGATPRQKIHETPMSNTQITEGGLSSGVVHRQHGWNAIRKVDALPVQMLSNHGNDRSWQAYPTTLCLNFFIRALMMRSNFNICHAIPKTVLNEQGCGGM